MTVDAKNLVLPDPLDAYRWHVATMLPHLHGWLHQNEFDRLATEEWEMPVAGRSASGVILMRGGPPQQTWLSVLTEMVEKDLVEKKLQDNAVYYRAKPELTNTPTVGP
jgi:hypothetical protein